MDTDFRLHGLDELDAKLKSLAALPRQKSTRAALRKAAVLVRDAAQANADSVDNPETRERIADNIVIRAEKKRYLREGELKYRIGVLGGAKSTSRNAVGKRRRQRKSGATTIADLGEIAGAGSGNPGGDTFYWRYLEFGTAKMPAQPFMRPALSSNTGAATEEFLQQFDKALTRAIRRANRAR